MFRQGSFEKRQSAPTEKSKNHKSFKNFKLFRQHQIYTHTLEKNFKNFPFAYHFTFFGFRAFHHAPADLRRFFAPVSLNYDSRTSKTASTY